MNFAQAPLAQDCAAPRTVTERDVTASDTTPQQFCTEASDLGWPVGKVPRELPTTMGNGENFMLMAEETRGVGEDREVVSWLFIQRYGSIGLRVFND